MKHLIPLVACIAGCSASSFRDRPTTDIHDRPSSVARIEAAEGRLEELELAIAARQKELNALDDAMDMLFQMANEVADAYDNFKSKQGMDIELGRITAQELRIVDRAGETIARLGTTADGDGDVAVWNRTGAEVFTAGGDSEGSGFLTVSNKVGTQTLHVSCEDGEASLEIMGKDQNVAVSIGALEDSSGFLIINNETGQPGVQAYIDDDALGRVEVFDGEI